MRVTDVILNFLVARLKSKNKKVKLTSIFYLFSISKLLLFQHILNIKNEIFSLLPTQFPNPLCIFNLEYISVHPSHTPRAQQSYVAGG